ncbi:MULTISPECIES: hypothetical protein [unclassified Mesorhizobium]|uniref:hypothetical protein n=1 Tax=unclassified Mesorhizobium TaxID=325217 RepID=UPI000FCAFDE5|nr:MULTISPECIES: hypothetical protein [unclassified Mesorhizobium]TGU07854.1 hypothetical protein EN806_31410 [bacterium M00.F.Ca.ET.163.01.1.1]TGU47060.1 hypothetical protein EN789_13585 [bacterium M00.F.Ca.ET.146.01.1.1]TGW12712.1 hypothetical protein EN788_08120 [Mesorhizobium sp. M2D.F.Ca.ET.145.01.1.1]TGP33330.1 hypothetical protein EN875_015420 [Mesorhizobium sp. M2D.F.Ca.ET.232.01.1.1]TGP59372.1 hypothetical protein EN869_013920 [Mesorhizobium sp. M2D.F.Ca.ET.226.01.1.1]
MTTKAEKLAALARDAGATESERQRAQEALDRLRAASAPPTPGSAEWRKEMLRHQHMVAQAAPLLGNPALTAAEAKILRNWIRGIGTPWDQGAEEFVRIHRKLMDSEPVNGAIALAYEPGMSV